MDCQVHWRGSRVSMTNPYAGMNDKKFKQTARSMSKKRSERERVKSERKYRKALTRHAKKDPFGFRVKRAMFGTSGEFDPGAGPKFGALLFGSFIIILAASSFIPSNPFFHSIISTP